MILYADTAEKIERMLDLFLQNYPKCVSDKTRRINRLKNRIALLKKSSVDPQEKDRELAKIFRTIKTMVNGSIARSGDDYLKYYSDLVVYL